ncbi:hypothetical protein H2Y56_05955 [Pectobacterium aroidearum]|jgi:hypothetical protein|uniref:Bbp19-like phage domain-containing protein n=1 Tax=Pectobacterium aroidearum TaxID=1201031 RepID=A0ABR5ZAV3_9GAMM|nr:MULTISPECIES: hypothetical protein [Pectobacterium]MBA5198870.1 hypothetical protein [Pectobacterium aroidearum]MBA5231662.1 hypothetical protein [Pectobacterium aroidearum]MBA5736840.1 hypothetical protein [Pectobacterium aroidearum]UXJ98900.1 hypothetical protein N5056_13820 [Pectobacterium aroidearum]GKV93532.1 hypothetical protein PEC301645_09790 [Pectobacterium carotovorum subsp. carotovorum]
MLKQVRPEDYRRIFEETPGGAEVLDELTRRFGGAVFVKGGPEGDRQTCFNAGRRDVLDFILRRLNEADGVSDDVVED